MREILTGIFTWPWFSEPHSYNFNGHFIKHTAGNLCIDPVEPSDEDLTELVRQGIARLLITNRNHSPKQRHHRSSLGHKRFASAGDVRVRRPAPHGWKRRSRK